MQVKKLEYYIDQFKQFLKRDRDFHEIYKWESLFHFKENWDIEAPDFGAMYDRSLQNNQTRRLWKRESWTPKEMMLNFCEIQPDFVRRMFTDLFDETKSVETRISRFKFACDELLIEYKTSHKTSIENNHYHDDFQMIMLYLTFQFPQKYTLYYYPAFSKMMRLLGITDVPGPHDIERFIKLTKILNTFLQKDKELLELQSKRLKTNRLDLEIGSLLVHDFYTVCATVELPAP
jgi:5-methylcytosine-specific restriction protein B